MKQNLRAELILAATTLVWGSTFIVTQEGFSVISPVLLIFIRFALSCLGLLFFVSRSLREAGKKAWLQGIILGALLYISYTTQSVGLKTTTVAKSAFITYTFSVLTPPLQLFLTKKPLKAGNISGLAIVFLGMFIFTRPEVSGIVIGDALTMICAVCFAFYIVYLDIFSRESDPSVLIWIQFLVVSVLAGLSFPLIEDPVFIPGAELLLRILYLAFPATLLALFAQNRYQKFTTPTRAVIIFSLEPVFASLLAFVITRRIPAGYEYLGAVLILSGLFLSEFWDYITCRIRHFR